MPRKSQSTRPTPESLVQTIAEAVARKNALQTLRASLALVILMVEDHAHPVPASAAVPFKLPKRGPGRPRKAR
jgi:hypothetical protein